MVSNVSIHILSAFLIDAIDPCYCQTPLCRGAFKGFKFLDETEQENLLPYAKWNVQLAYWTDKRERL